MMMGMPSWEFIKNGNDCITNDIMFLKRDVADVLIEKASINSFCCVIMCQPFMVPDDCYEEWWDDIKDAGGWVCMVNSLIMWATEMKRTRLQYYTHFGAVFNDVNWHNKLPEMVFQEITGRLAHGQRYLEWNLCLWTSYIRDAGSNRYIEGIKISSLRNVDLWSAALRLSGVTPWCSSPMMMAVGWLKINRMSREPLWHP